MRKIVLAALAAALAGCLSVDSDADSRDLPVDLRGKASARHAQKVKFAERLAANGIVLLKNDGNLLPLEEGQEVALLGFTSYWPHRMGWGSGDMPAHEPVPYDKGLEAAGIRLSPAFADLYRAERAVRLEKGVYDRLNRDWQKWTPRFEELDLSDREFDEVASRIDRSATCLVTIGRAAGESQDLEDSPGSYRLHAQERQLLKNACRNFDNVIVLLNTCGVIDTSFMDEFPIKGLVHTSLLGQTSGSAVAGILSGRVTPSGKTVDTWAKHYFDYPTTDCFGAMEVPYREGSFVGYRHFDNKGIVPRYPFGFGLSYTTFGLSFGKAKVEGTKVRIPVIVRNTGPRKGAEVVQAYLAHPGRDASVEPAKRLCAFDRTKVLAPGAVQMVPLSLDVRDHAVYDEATASWILTGGTYVILVGDSSATAAPAVKIDLPRMVVEKTVNRFGKDAPVHVPAEPLEPSPFEETLTMDDVLAGIATVEQVVSQFSDEELVSIVNGRPPDGGSAAGGGFWGSAKYAIPALTCADGPSGVRLAAFDVPVSKYPPMAARLVSWPCATALAQGWDVAAAEWFGRLVADDMAAADVDGWLAPGVNVHRNPLCGRNFEYFSEDPYLSGKLGAAIVRGIQKKGDGSTSGRYATVKHFCTNNQERHRSEQTNLVSEKALREIYLKPFEIVVKESQPHALMSGCNRLNGESCATSERLLTDILRKEWGYRGLVMTGWQTLSDRRLLAAAGNDVAMPGAARERGEMLAALKKGEIARGDLERSAVRILTVVLNRLKAKK